MGTRLALHEVLCTALGSRKAYFQPNETIKMDYPCIVYQLSGIKIRFADGSPYSHKRQYTVTVIDKNPDSLIPEKISKMPLCAFDRFFVTNNLNHTVFRLYY